MLQSARVSVLIKALPHPSKTYGETVCCAGVTAEGKWLRLFPVRFRHLSGGASFSRWDWVNFRYGRPKSDRRAESCHVHEDSISVGGKLKESDRTRLLEPLMVGSAKEAAGKGHSLALIRPRNTRFFLRAKRPEEIDEEREAFRNAARQIDIFDKELAALDPSPYEFKFRFTDAAGAHEYRNGDWETHAMFWRERQNTSEEAALKWMSQIFNEDYPAKGMAFALGNMASRPQTWQLLGVLRLDEPAQQALMF